MRSRHLRSSAGPSKINYPKSFVCEYHVSYILAVHVQIASTTNTLHVSQGKGEILSSVLVIH